MMILLQLLGTIHLLPIMNHNKQRVLWSMSTKTATWHLFLERRVSLCLTLPRGCLASGPLGLDPVSGVSVTILNTCNRGRWSKSICLPGPLLQDSINLAQFLLPGPAQKSGCLPGLYTWDCPVQEPQFQLQIRGSFRWVTAEDTSRGGN